ncbi:MAG TPA: NUDIX hydrolase [Streptosporangiaceae bacterium]|jgi:ADP-ribose pyrophosphatase
MTEVDKLDRAEPLDPAGSPSGERPVDAAGRWPVTASSVLGSGAIVTVRQDTVRLPDGQEMTRDVVEHPGAVAIVAIDEQDRVLMIRQYRHPAGAFLWEVPAGLRDVADEPLVETARRELLEEAGYRAAQWHVLTDYLSSPGISTERIRVFLARELTWVPEAERGYVRQHEEAYLTAEWLPLTAAVRGILAGDLHNGVAIIGVLSAYAAHDTGFSALRRADEPENL